MSTNMSSLGAWIEADIPRLLQGNDEQRAIVQHYVLFWEHFDRGDNMAEMAINRALEAAQACDEIRWVLLLRHWRLQFWLRQYNLKRTLPEAIDLLTLATDERLRDVPQRICAYHDVVECYVYMDARGFYNEICENSQTLLDQLPERYPCATCMRSHLALAEAAVRHTDEAAHWIALCRANLSQPLYSELALVFYRIYEYLGQWEEARRAAHEAAEISRREKSLWDYVKALLAEARACVGLNDLSAGATLLAEARQHMKRLQGSGLLARLLEVEGALEQALEHLPRAVDYLAQAAQVYLDLACFRDAANCALTAVELARGAEVSRSTKEALRIAALAVGQLPPASQDLYERLRACGAEPAPLQPLEALTLGASAEEETAAAERQELHTLEQNLRSAITMDANAHDVTLLLYRLARWHADHEEWRAALDYCLWTCVLERAMHLPGEERSPGLQLLATLRQRLPADVVEAAFAAAAEEPPAWLLNLGERFPAARRRWLLHAVVCDLDGQPVVVPESASEGENTFEEWLEHCASMVALVLRFRERADPQKLARWLTTLEEVAQEQRKDLEAQRIPVELIESVISLVEGWIALCRGVPPEQVAGEVAPLFRGVIEQVAAAAGRPLWQHPGIYSPEQIIEQAAQRAVTALRIHDEHRDVRQANLAFRYELMCYDLREVEGLQPLARFLEALGQLVLAGGQEVPRCEPPLAEPLVRVLEAVCRAAQEQGKVEGSQ